MDNNNHFWNSLVKEAGRDTSADNDLPWWDESNFDYKICAKCNGDVPAETIDDSGMCKWCRGEG